MPLGIVTIANCLAAYARHHDMEIWLEYYSRRVFGRENVFTFSVLILGQYSHQNISISHIKLQHSHRIGIFFLVKRLNYPYCHLLPPTAGRCPPPSNHCRIFGNVQNIPENSIYLSNAFKTRIWKWKFKSPTTKCPADVSHISFREIPWLINYFFT